MSTPREERPDVRDGRPAVGDARPAPVTSGARGGISGALDWRTYGRVLPLITAVVALVCTMNVLSDLHDADRAGYPLPVWKPVVWEGTSLVTVVAASALAWAALRIAPPGGRWLRLLSVHGIGVLAFSAAHILAALAMRKAIYAAARQAYGFGWNDAADDFGKDILAYAGFIAVMWLAPRLWRPPAVAPTPEAVAPAEAVGPIAFDILEGARTLRTPPAQILAVRAAGNYVEFLLVDGRRPLMRAPLADIEQALAPAGFLRTHRSWIVNPAHVRVLEPSGSGDHRVGLSDGAQAPVSRRFRAALERLKAAR